MLLLRPTLPVLTATSFLTSTFLLTHCLAPPQSRRLLLDAGSSPIANTLQDSLFSQSQRSAGDSALLQQQNQPILTARNVRQISTGSVLGTRPFFSTSFRTTSSSPLQSFIPVHCSILLLSMLTLAYVGLLAGLAVSLFSRPLAILLGLLVAGVQACETRGIHIIPYKRLERWFRGVNVRSAVRENVALKLSFGTSFALAGFASF